ncbi:MAG: hypothetical protein E7329_06005 [Clostridiales bacterium]|nr:hypothetical protein [Clostridiales bacterium]
MIQESAPSVVCLGFFDGVHRGHLALLETACRAAKEEHLQVCVHTFDHAPGVKRFELTTLEERIRLLKEAGADRVAVSVFDQDMRHMSGEDFFDKIVMEKLGARHVVCGDDHRFGYKGACGVKELEKMCRENGVGLSVVPPVTLPGGERISSTAIRQAIEQGDEDLVFRMLGRPADENMKRRAGLV